MKSGFCTCGKGVNFAPCKHKSAVASLYNIAEFSVAPIDDPCARALYHYIATGTTLPAHMYRERGSGQTVPEIEKYIEEKLKGKNCERHDLSVLCDDPIVIEAGLSNENEEREDENEERENENEQIRQNFMKAMQDYVDKVVEMSSGDAGTLKAMRLMTKTLKKSMKCNPNTIQQQLATFGKLGAAGRQSKHNRIIKPNPPAISARLAPGSMPAPLGRRFKDRSGQVLVGAAPDGSDVTADRPPVYRGRRVHDLAEAVRQNLPGPR